MLKFPIDISDLRGLLQFIDIPLSSRNYNDSCSIIESLCIKGWKVENIEIGYKKLKVGLIEFFILNYLQKWIKISYLPRQLLPIFFSIDSFFRNDILLKIDRRRVLFQRATPSHSRFNLFRFPSDCVHSRFLPCAGCVPLILIALLQCLEGVGYLLGVGTLRLFR